MDNHLHEYCYVDPASKHFKPEVRVRRIQAAKNRGGSLPAYLQEENPGSVGHVAQAGPGNMVEDLVGALRLVGGMQEDQI